MSQPEKDEALGGFAAGGIDRSDTFIVLNELAIGFAEAQHVRARESLLEKVRIGVGVGVGVGVPLLMAGTAGVVIWGERRRSGRGRGGG